MRKKRFSVEQMMGILKQAEVGYQPHLAAERAGAAHAGERVRRRRIFRRGRLRRAERAAQRSPRHVRRAVRGAGAVPSLQRGIRVLRGQPQWSSWNSYGEVRLLRFNTQQMQTIPLSEPRL